MTETNTTSKNIPPPMTRAAALPLESKEEVFFRKALKWSTIVHCVLILYSMISSIIFPGTPKTYIPSVKVDLIGLPDIKKADLSNATPSADMDSLKKQLQALEKEYKPKPVEKAKPAEKVKPVAPKDDAMGMKAKTQDRKQLLNDAISRMKSLQAIEEQVKKTQVAAKGNKLSKGSQLTGVQSDDGDTYVDELVGRIRNNWNLPLWLSKQTLSAKVVVYVDERGAIERIVFVEGSGNAQYDQYVKRSIEASAPFGIPPDDLLSNGVMLGFPL